MVSRVQYRLDWSLDVHPHREVWSLQQQQQQSVGAASAAGWLAGFYDKLNVLIQENERDKPGSEMNERSGGRGWEEKGGVGGGGKNG